MFNIRKIFQYCICKTENTEQPQIHVTDINLKRLKTYNNLSKISSKDRKQLFDYRQSFYGPSISTSDKHSTLFSGKFFLAEACEEGNENPPLKMKKPDNVQSYIRD